MLPSLFKIFMSALKLSGAEIRQAFLDFYSQRGHQPLPSGSLVPEDPTVLTILQGERLRQRGDVTI
jgi:tRNA synthetases class II (A)